MENKEENIFADKGGINPINEGPNLSYLKFCDEHVEFVRKVYPELPPIKCVLIQNELLSSSAAITKEGKYYIGFYQGLDDGIQDIFFKANAHKVGPQLSEIKLDSFYKTPQGVQYLPDPGPIPIPKPYFFHKDDIDVTDCWVIMINRFIIFHEIGHVLRGHVDLVQKEFEKNIDENRFDDDENFVSYMQTLEMDADSFAINRSINMFLEGSIAKDGIWEKVCGSLEDYICNLVYCLYLFFKVSGYDEVDIATQRKHTHPAPSVRMTMIIRNIEAIFHKYNLPEREYIGLEIFSAIDKADIDFCHIAEKDRSIRDFCKIFTAQSTQDYIDRVMANWELLHPRLSKYTKGKLPPIR